MPNDYFMIFSALKEIKEKILPAKINKIAMPFKDTVILTLYSGGSGAHKLLLSCSAESPRIHLTKGSFENPETPFTFTMALRKHLGGGTVFDITTEKYDRTVYLEISASTEMKDCSRFKLTLEIAGRQSNLLLLNAENKILNAVKTNTLDSAQERKILPGLGYQPPKNDKIYIDDGEKLKALIDNHEGGDYASLIASKVSGTSKKTAAYIVSLANESKSGVLSALKDFNDNINGGSVNPCIQKENGKLLDFFPMQYGSGDFEFYGANECIDLFYSDRGSSSSLESMRNQQIKAVETLLGKCIKKITTLRETIAKQPEMESYKLCGDLITANMFKLKGGETIMKAESFYDENCTVSVPLEQNLSPAQNAQKYYKKYAKLRTAINESGRRIKEAASLSEYYEGVLHFIESAENVNELKEIQDELNQGTGHRAQDTGTDKGRKKKQEIKAKVNFEVIDGFTVIYGKNNIQNEYVTGKEAKPSDLWFHVLNKPGAHLVIKCEGKTPSESVVKKAAELTAKLSKAGGKTAVVYTQRKNLKKPPGSRPGYFIYTEHKEIIVVV